MFDEWSLNLSSILTHIEQIKLKRILADQDEWHLISVALWLENAMCVKCEISYTIENQMKCLDDLSVNFYPDLSLETREKINWY